MSASRTIHALVARLALCEEDYRALLWDRYKAASSKDLTEAQSLDLVAALHSLLPAEQRKRNPRPQIAHGAGQRFEALEGRDGMASAKQLRMLEASWVQRSRAPTLAAKQAAFLEFLRTRFRVERIEWVAKEDVGRILRAVQAVDPDALPKPKRRTTITKGT